MNHVINAIENKKHTLGIFIDLSKAFDTIDHGKLMVKLENCGIRGNCFELIKNYLSPRKQCTMFLNEKSDHQSVLYGVPQGSVIGPLLFILYINDIVKASNGGLFILFADDTNIFITADTEAEAYRIANEVLISVHCYMINNKLHINLGKCVYIHFRPRLNNNQRMTCARTRSREEELSLSLNGIKLKKVTKTRFLGVIIDENLTWDDHIEYLESKLNSCIVMIKRIRKSIPKAHYKMIYHSLFESHLTYCISAWGGASPSKLHKIVSIQKRCIRILFGEKLSFDHPEFYETCARARTYQEHKAPKNFELEHTKPLFNKHNLLKLQNLYSLRMFLETYKIMKNHQPISLFSLLSVNTASKRHIMILPPKVSLDISKNNFVYKTCFIWNKCVQKVFVLPELDLKIQIVIPGSVTNSDFTASIPFVKNRIKCHLLQIQAIGSHNEWLPHNHIIFK